MKKKRKGLSQYNLEIIETDKGFTIQDNLGFEFYKLQEVLARVKKGIEVTTGLRM